MNRRKRKSNPAQNITAISIILVMLAAFFILSRTQNPGGESSGSASSSPGSSPAASQASSASGSEAASESGGNSSASSETGSDASSSKPSGNDSSKNTTSKAGTLTASQIKQYLNSAELKLVSRSYPIGEAYTPTHLKTIPQKYCPTSTKKYIDAVCYDELIDMLADLYASGRKAYVNSAYRSYSTQENIYSRSVQAYIKQGYSQEKAEKETQRTIMPPGYSEHQYGYAADISSSGTLTEDLKNSKAFKWLSANCYKYGFILRYPEGKENITGVSYEPWHFRYVGKAHAKKIFEQNVTLEEYIADLQKQLDKLEG